MKRRPAKEAKIPITSSTLMQRRCSMKAKRGMYVKQLATYIDEKLPEVKEEGNYVLTESFSFMLWKKVP